MSSNFTVLYDANIFFGAFRRTVMINLAQAGIYRDIVKSRVRGAGASSSYYRSGSLLG
jgi:hypothetical protein